MEHAESVQTASQIPMKVDPTLAAPPGLEHPRLEESAATAQEYSVGEEILALRSNGLWSPGKITKIEGDKVAVVLKEGVKHIRKDKMHALMKKLDLVDPLKEAKLANQNAALQVENARLVQENIMMAKQASLQAENARLAQENMMMRMQSQSTALIYDPAMMNSWDFPQLDGTIPNSWSKIGARKASDSGSGTESTSTGGSSKRVSFADDEPEKTNPLAHLPSHELTTIMMRNIPNNVTREQLLVLVDDEGFQGRYDFLYLPVDLKKKVGLGYAFINFASHEDAEAFAQHFRGFNAWNMQSEKVCEITWSDVLQGLDAHVERYRDCPVMHESISDEFKPVIFQDGARVPFPAPTKKIRAPRPWCRRH